MQRREVEPGKVYASRRGSKPFRRVIAVIDGKVSYNCGGDRNYWCSLQAFKRATKPEPPAIAGCLNRAKDLLSVS